MGLSRQEYWSGLPFPSAADFSDSGIEPGSPALQADSLPSEPPEKPFLKHCSLFNYKILFKFTDGLMTQIRLCAQEICLTNTTAKCPQQGDGL